MIEAGLQPSQKTEQKSKRTIVLNRVVEHLPKKYRVQGSIFVTAKKNPDKKNYI